MEVRGTVQQGHDKLETGRVQRRRGRLHRRAQAQREKRQGVPEARRGEVGDGELSRGPGRLRARATD